MVLGRAQVLAKRHHVDAHGADVIQGAIQFVVGLAQPQHQAGLGQRLGSVALGKRQHVQGLRVTGARVSHRMGQSLDRFQILRVRDQPGIEHRGHRIEVAGKVRGQRFHRGLRRALVNGLDAGRVVRCAAIGQIVAIDRGQHHVFQRHQCDRIGHLHRLQRIQPTVGIAGADRAELARTRAYRTHQHQRGGAAAPAFSDIRALGLGADRVELVRIDNVTHFLIARAGGQLYPQPCRFSLDIRHATGGVRTNAVHDRARTLRTGEFGPGRGVGKAGIVGHERHRSLRRDSCPIVRRPVPQSSEIRHACRRVESRPHENRRRSDSVACPMAFGKTRKTFTSPHSGARLKDELRLVER